MKLHSVRDPGTYKIRSVHVSPSAADQLAEMGLVPGAKIEVAHNDFKGTLAVCCNHEWIILGRAETFNIQVAAISQPVKRDR